MATRIGTNGDDSIFGTRADDLIQLLDGDDHGRGLGGNDTMFGGVGDDIVEGSEGRDQLFGGPGDDLLIGHGQKDSAFGGSGNDDLHGDHGDDVMMGESGDDAVFGDRASDVVFGGSGDDLTYGGSGPVDALVDGNDTVFGGSGDDTVTGERGYDLVYGGSGNDIFQYVGGLAYDIATDELKEFAFERDVVLDFVKGEDLIDIIDYDTRKPDNPSVSFADLDSNHNNRLDDGDAHVEIRKVAVAGLASQVSTVIDVEAALHLRLEGDNTLTLFGVTGLRAGDFAD